jgi:2-oxoglutarate-Fe(II)-dependent oxygenase superfamily protein
VIDNFLPEHVLDEVLTEFPTPEGADWFAFDSATERKLATKDDSTMGPATRQLLAELNSAAFIEFLERITGIEGLVPDPHFVGGGLHQIEPGGHLKVHADFNRHPRTQLERRLNVLIYLNRDWNDEYGGAFELWDKNMTRCEEKVMPYFNRCVVFSTTSTSYHGHPEPLACPKGQTRKSIALYYYSKDRPAEERGTAHNTLFKARPGEDLPEPAPTQAVPVTDRIKAGLRQIAPPILVETWRRRREHRE